MIIYDLICFIRVRCVLLFPLECIRPEESEVWWELTDPPGLHNRALKAAKGPCSNESALRLGKIRTSGDQQHASLERFPGNVPSEAPSRDPGLQQSISRVRTSPFPSASLKPEPAELQPDEWRFFFLIPYSSTSSEGWLVDRFPPRSGLQAALQEERRRLALHPGVDASALPQKKKTARLCTRTLKFSLNAEIFRPPTTTASLKHL